MNKRILTIIVFTLLTLAVNAQSNELLIGKWVFMDAYNKEKIDEAGLQMLKTDIINKMTFDFKQNSSFSSFVMGETMNGTWLLTKDSKKVLIKTPDGPFEFQILKLTKTELALKIGLGEFLMKKTKN
jgi:hypothetical protein